MKTTQGRKVLSAVRDGFSSSVAISDVVGLSVYQCSALLHRLSKYGLVKRSASHLRTDAVGDV
jgi:hypothetical protein